MTKIAKRFVWALVPVLWTACTTPEPTPPKVPPVAKVIAFTASPELSVISAPGASRLASAAAMTIGMLGLLLGSVRLVMVIAAIDRIDGMLK